MNEINEMRADTAHISPTPWSFNEQEYYIKDATGEQITTVYGQGAEKGNRWAKWRQPRTYPKPKCWP